MYFSAVIRYLLPLKNKFWIFEVLDISSFGCLKFCEQILSWITTLKITFIEKPRKGDFNFSFCDKQLLTLVSHIDFQNKYFGSLKTIFADFSLKCDHIAPHKINVSAKEKDNICDRTTL